MLERGPVGRGGIRGLVLVAAAGAAMTLTQAALGQWANPDLNAQDPAFLGMEMPPLLFEHDADGHPVGCGKACAYRHMYAMQVAAGIDPAQMGPNGQMIPGLRFAPRGPGATDPTDVLNNALEIEVNPALNSTITGTNTITIKSNVNNLTSFTFMLRSSYTVTSCTVTDSVGSYSVTPTLPGASSYARTITLTRPIQQNQTFTVAIGYTGSAPPVGLGSVTVGTQNGVAGAPPVFTTLSQPYYAGSWWPCKDGDVLTAGDNIDKATATVSITCPDTLTGLSNGLLQGVDTLSGSRKRYRWATNYPMATYLLFVSVSVYSVDSDWPAAEQQFLTYTYPPGSGPGGNPAGGTMPIMFRIYPSQNTAANRAVWNRVPAMLEAFRPVYGLYPFINEKYGIYQFEFSGGQEHQTFTGQGRSGAFVESITAHELGHQWWGDWVTCRTWSDIWLNEGFATYSEAIWEERKPGSTGAAALRSAMLARKPSSPTGSVYVPVTDANSANTVSSVNRIFSSDLSYKKPAWVLHTLRRTLGDTMFFQVLANWRAQYGGSSGTTSNFVSVVNATAGRDLSPFFNSWIFGSGAPNYAFGWQNVTINGQPYVRVSITQTNATAGATTVFVNPIDVAITTASGTTIVPVQNDAGSEWYLLPVAGTVTGVALDPNDWVLNYGKTSGSYVQGPPKIVTTAPAPGTNLPANAVVNSIGMRFSDAVTIPTGAIAVTRGTTSIPFTLSNPVGPDAVTLTFASNLAPGTYTVVVSDTVTGPGGLALDGELATNSTASLASGNGTPGGIATYSFTIAASACVADFDRSGIVEVADIFAFLSAWFAQSPSADIDGNNVVEVADIFAYLSRYFAGC